MAEPTKVYDALSEASVDEMLSDVEQAFQNAITSMEHVPTTEPPTPPQISPIPELIGVDPEVYRQINAALAAGVRNFMFYGPPGTGKTTLAQRVAGEISPQWRMITGSADWTSQDIIGGYSPLASGGLIFMPGILLEHFDKPLIFDELNRCDIDKVIGPLFTVLSGQSTTLPYLTDPSDPNSLRVEIAPRGESDPPATYAPSPRWRLIATINSIDKASLYQMSYALTRRFAWIYIDVPKNTRRFIEEYVAREHLQLEPAADAPSPLATLWSTVNVARPIGAAPILDIMRLMRAQDDVFNFFSDVSSPSEADLYLDGFYVFLLPMLDGILKEEGETLAEAVGTVLKIKGDERYERLKQRLLAVTL